jgi:hypothetical protein
MTLFGGWRNGGAMVLSVAAAITLLAPLGGCDDTPEPPAELLLDRQPSADAELPAVPTTQELTQGPYKTLQLAHFPLTLSVPESWKIETLGGDITLLRGFAPSGPVEINLKQRHSTTQEKIDFMLEGAKREMAADPEHIEKAEMRKKGNMQIFERQQLTRNSIPPDPLNPQSTDLGPGMRWTITAYVPNADKGFDEYVLNFVALTDRQFEQDESFLRNILETLTLTGAAPLAPQPEAVTPSPALP